MSNLNQALQQSISQVPVSAYFDADVFAREQRRIFDAAPRYMGHALSVPNPGDFASLVHEGDGRALVCGRDDAHPGVQNLHLLSNVCRHRQAVILRGRGNLAEASDVRPGALGCGHAGGQIVCPLHRWTYAPTGELVGAPHFPIDPKLNLQRFALDSWQGLQFERPRNGEPRNPNAELAQLASVAQIDFSGYQYHSHLVHQCNYNWKTFIEVYLEDYHVGPAHPGLGGFVTCDELRWQYGAGHSVQTVGVNRDLAQPGSPVYQRWHDAVRKFSGGELPDVGAIWLTYYPHTMVEWYPHVLVVSSLHPSGPQQTMNLVEFFYPEEITAFEPEFIDAQRAAYQETCAEDDEIALRMDAGRKALLVRGENEAGPYQSPMEDGMQHFHEWYLAQMRNPTGLSS